MSEYYRTKISSAEIKDTIMKHNINNKGDKFDITECMKGFKYYYSSNNTLRFLDFTIKGSFLQKQDFAIFSIDLEINRILKYFINIVSILYSIIFFMYGLLAYRSHIKLIAFIALILLFFPITYDLIIYLKSDKFIKKIKKSLPYMEPISKNEYDRLADENSL